MPLYECSACPCVENTALANYWWGHVHNEKPALCSECDPGIGKWHGEFPKEAVYVRGLVTNERGFLEPRRRMEMTEQAIHKTRVNQRSQRASDPRGGTLRFRMSSLPEKRACGVCGGTARKRNGLLACGCPYAALARELAKQ
jgi:hypothetical protein